jgi:hypothetical protein
MVSVVLLVLSVCAGAGLALAGHAVWGAVAAMILLVTAVLAAALSPGPEDTGRRRFLATIGFGGVALATAGVAGGASVRRAETLNPTEVVDEMAAGLGDSYMEFMRRGYYPGRSGELQLVLSPGNTSNYPEESTSLVARDPRSSHSSVWNYLERVPITVYAPGIVKSYDNTDEVTLADVAPTTAALMRFDFHAPDGSPLPGIETPKHPPKVIVTFVIDGGGWNVLKQWPNAWPNLAGLMRDGANYRNAFMGSFPSVTACAHATIGTGAFPMNHGISGHFIRQGTGVVQAYGSPGWANTESILVPTLSEAWSEEVGDKAWIGEIGYQIWHVGMIGRGANRPQGRLPVGVYFADKPPKFASSDWKKSWAPQNPDWYRMPDKVPPMSALWQALASYQAPNVPTEVFTPGKTSAAYQCCSPPIVEHQGQLIADAFASEPIGQGDVTDLLFINFKTPDYTGHVYNMLAQEEEIALQAVDTELGKLRALLEKRFKPGEFALIVCADHGQCPLPDSVGGVRLDPIQLADDIDAQFGTPAGMSIVQSVRPSEVYMDLNLMWDMGISQAQVAAWLRDYTYGENVHVYSSGTLSFEGHTMREHTSPASVQRNQTNHWEFSAVLPADFLEGLRPLGPVMGFGPGIYRNADIGVQPAP